MDEMIENRYYETYYRDSLAVINLKKDIFELISSIEESQGLMEFIKKSEHDQAVRGLIMFNEPGSLGVEAYDNYVRKILKAPLEVEDKEKPDLAEGVTRFRQMIILGRFLKFLGNYQKLLVTAVSSTITTPFIGGVLVADIRLASPGACFKLTHRKYGLHPSGGIPFLFPGFIGMGRSIEMQLSDKIEAEKGFRLGFFNQILPSDHFEDNCIRYVQPYLKGCPSTVRLTRRLNAYNYRGLDGYLELEASLLNL